MEVAAGVAGVRGVVRVGGVHSTRNKPNSSDRVLSKQHRRPSCVAPILCCSLAWTRKTLFGGLGMDFFPSGYFGGAVVTLLYASVAHGWSITDVLVAYGFGRLVAYKLSLIDQ